MRGERRVRTVHPGSYRARYDTRIYQCCFGLRYAAFLTASRSRVACGESVNLLQKYNQAASRINSVRFGTMGDERRRWDSEREGVRSGEMRGGDSEREVWRE